jgi:PAS domain S-box-containing protein
MRIADEYQFIELFNLSPSMTGVTKLSDGLILAANPAATELTGYNSSEWFGKTTAELGIYANEGERDRIMDLVREKGEIRNYEFLLRRKDGQTRTCLLSLKPFPYNGEDCLLFIITDISEQKQAEDELRESELRFRTMMEQSPFSMLVLSMDGCVVESNEAHSRLWGIDPELIQSGYSILKDPQLEKMGLIPLIRKAFQGEHVVLPAMEYELSGASGTTKKIVVKENFYPLRGLDGAIRYIILVQEDVTETWISEKAFRESEERFSLAFRSSPAPMLISEIDSGLMLDANNHWLSLLGYTREEMIGRTSFELEIWENPDSRSTFAAKLSKEGSVHDLPMRFRTKTGELVDVLWAAEKTLLGANRCCFPPSTI